MSNIVVEKKCWEVLLRNEVGRKGMAIKGFSPSDVTHVLNPYEAKLFEDEIFPNWLANDFFYHGTTGILVYFPTEAGIEELNKHYREASIKSQNLQNKPSNIVINGGHIGTFANAISINDMVNNTSFSISNNQFLEKILESADFSEEEKNVIQDFHTKNPTLLNRLWSGAYSLLHGLGQGIGNSL